MAVSDSYRFWACNFMKQNISFIPVGNCLFHEQVAEFQPAVTVKNYFIGDFQAFYIRMRSNYSKAFIYLK